MSNWWEIAKNGWQYWLGDNLEIRLKNPYAVDNALWLAMCERIQASGYDFYLAGGRAAWSSMYSDSWQHALWKLKKSPYSIGVFLDIDDWIGYCLEYFYYFDKESRRFEQFPTSIPNACKKLNIEYISPKNRAKHSAEYAKCRIKLLNKMMIAKRVKYFTLWSEKVLSLPGVTEKFYEVGNGNYGSGYYGALSDITREDYSNNRAFTDIYVYFDIDRSYESGKGYRYDVQRNFISKITVENDLFLTWKAYNYLYAPENRNDVKEFSGFGYNINIGERILINTTPIIKPGASATMFPGFPQVPEFPASDPFPPPQGPYDTAVFSRNGYFFLEPYYNFSSGFLFKDPKYNDREFDPFTEDL